jgi:hypothetical protein
MLIDIGRDNDECTCCDRSWLDSCCLLAVFVHLESFMCCREVFGHADNTRELK